MKFLNDGDMLVKTCVVMAVTINISKFGAHSLTDGKDLIEKILFYKDQDIRYDIALSRFLNAD